MSRLKLFLGDETAHALRVTSDPLSDESAPKNIFGGQVTQASPADRDSVTAVQSPAILNYQSYADRWRKYRNSPLNRARTLRCNNRCPHCSHGLIEPLELADGVQSRNSQPIPGTATLVGFHCLSCHWEWPA